MKYLKARITRLMINYFASDKHRSGPALNSLFQAAHRIAEEAISYDHVYRDNFELTIVNADTQFHWGGPGLKLNYETLRSVMRSIKQNYHGKRIGYPKIGGGLAGGN